jgi:hypothetical protein
VALPVSPLVTVASADGAARRLVQMVGSKGVADPTWWRPMFCRQPGVIAWVSASAACSGPRRLALLGNCQCGVGLRQRTALVATTLWDN